QQGRAAARADARGTRAGRDALRAGPAGAACGEGGAHPRTVVAARRRSPARGAPGWNAPGHRGRRGRPEGVRREAQAAVQGAMTLEALVALTRERLGQRNRRVVPPGPLVRAAVLVPIIDRREPSLLFAKRTERVGHHKGQISFPGGVVRPEDPSLLDAALRECDEEIGLAPHAVETLGTLDATETVATQFVITPFGGLIREPPAWRAHGGEIRNVIEGPLAALLD